MSISHPLVFEDSDSDFDESFDFINPQSVPQMFLETKKNSCNSEHTSPSSSSSFSSSASKNQYLYPKCDTVELLRPEEVRWFFKGNNDKKWTPFIGYDSLRIECKYREIEHRSEKQNVSSDYKSERICVRGSLYEIDVQERQCYPIYWHTQNETASIMRGIWFLDHTWQPLEDEFSSEVEKMHLIMFLHQSIENTQEETAKLPLPVLLLKEFKDFYIEWNAVNKVILHYKSTTSKIKRAFGNRLGFSQGGTTLHRGYSYEACMEDKPAEIGHLVFVVHGIGQKMDMGSIVQRCRELRETCEKMNEKHIETSDDLHKRAEFLPVEWRSLLKLDGDIVESITPSHFLKLRSLLNASAMDILYYTSPLYRAEITQGLQSELNRLYTMFCERTPYFEASGGKVSIVAHSLGSVIVYDIITGWNPIQLYDQYVTSVINSESSNTSINSQTERPWPQNPDIDIIERNLEIKNQAEKCSQLGTAGDELLCKLQAARNHVTELESDLFKLAASRHNKTPTLNFKLENLFMVGAPLSVFLALRAVRPQGTGTLENILPKSLCKRLFNIYHPYDPVAYRIEPLVLKHYSTILPLKIYPEYASNKLPYDCLPAVAFSDKQHAKSVADASPKKKQSTPEKNNNTEKSEAAVAGGGKSWGNWFRRGSKDQNKSPPKVHTELRVMSMKDLEQSPTNSDTDTDISVAEVANDPDSPDLKLFLKSETTEQTELEYRLDYTLHKGKMVSAYWSALTSHTSYWTNPDVALFLLQHLHPNKFPTEKEHNPNINMTGLQSNGAI